MTFKLLLVLASTVILDSKLHWTHDHNLLSDDFLRLCLKYFQDNSSALTTQKTQSPYCQGGMFTSPLRVHINGRGAENIKNTVILLLRVCMLRPLRNNECSLSRSLHRYYTLQYI
jgi:hypothetical protein